MGARRGGGTIDERKGVLNDGHHPESEEIDFHDPHVGAVVLVPLHHDAARHAGVLERDDRIEASLTDHHAARVLAQMPRQILHLLPQLREETHAVRVHVESDRGQVACQRGVGRRVDELEVIHRLREPIDLWRLETKRLPHFSRRTPAAIRNDIGGHRGAELSVFLVDVLNHLFAAVAARQIEINIGPLAAFLREKALEEQVHADGVHCRNAKAVADGAVGGRPASLHEDVVLTAVVHDVPHDQEVAGELELLDHVQLARDLRTGLVVVRPIPIACAKVGHATQERRLCLTGRHRVLRKAIAQVGHRELQAIGQREGTRERLRLVREQHRHLLARFEIALGIRRQSTTGARQIGVVMDAGEHVEQRTFGRRGEPRSVGGEHRDTKRLGHGDERLVIRLLIAPEVALQFDVRALPAEQPDDAIE